MFKDGTRFDAASLYQSMCQYYNISKKGGIMSQTTQKLWLSPFLAITFGVVGITGIFMLFHLKLPGAYAVHQWGGALLLVAGMIHLFFHWKVFLSYFRQNRAVYGALAGLMLMVFIAVVVPTGHHDDLSPRGYDGYGGYQTNHSR